MQTNIALKGYNYDYNLYVRWISIQENEPTTDESIALILIRPQICIPIRDYRVV